MKKVLLTACPATEDSPSLVEPPLSRVGGADRAEIIDRPASGSVRAVIEAMIATLPTGILGVVVDTLGSTYSKLGSLISISPSQGRVGWISGGCLESALEEEARVLQAEGRAGFTEFDTRSDADLMFGTRIGCRGVVRIGLLPLSLLPGIERILRRWTSDAVDIVFNFSPGGHLQMSAGDDHLRWLLPWRDACQDMEFEVLVARAPQLLVFGGGPESALLVPWMRQLGWYVGLVERRAHWTAQLGLADLGRKMTPEPAVTDLSPLRYDAAIIMNHDFELDREALESLAGSAVPWIGLLGPARRRDDLLRLLEPAWVEALQPSLRAPVGLPLGGRGPEAIALAIVAELHGHWNKG